MASSAMAFLIRKVFLMEMLITQPSDNKIRDDNEQGANVNSVLGKPPQSMLITIQAD